MQPGGGRGSLQVCGLNPWKCLEAFFKEVLKVGQTVSCPVLLLLFASKTWGVDLLKNFHFCLKQPKFRKEVLGFSLLLCV